MCQDSNLDNQTNQIERIETEMSNPELCSICSPGVTPDGAGFCDKCLDKYPSALLKAFADPFDYAAQIKNGPYIRFETVLIRGNWITFSPAGTGQGFARFLPPTYPSCPRGIDVRLSDILWVADAPDGS